jgi:hypothetical protein
MLALCFLLFSSVLGATPWEKAVNSRGHFFVESYHLQGDHFTTYPAPLSIEGMLAHSSASALLEANATASFGGSHLTINVQADILRGFFSFWVTGDVTRQILRHHLPPPLMHLISGARFSECFALHLGVSRMLVERFLERIRTRQEMQLSFLTYYPTCFVDGVEGYRIGTACLSKQDYTILGFAVGRVFIKFEGQQEWKGPLDHRPSCANVDTDARWAAPALQFLVESLPDSDFKKGAQHLIADMSEPEQQDSSVMNIPTFIGILAGVSLVSVITGFAIGQRSEAQSMDSYESVNE